MWDLFSSSLKVFLLIFFFIFPGHSCFFLFFLGLGLFLVLGDKLVLESKPIGLLNFCHLRLPCFLYFMSIFGCGICFEVDGPES